MTRRFRALDLRKDPMDRRDFAFKAPARQLVSPPSEVDHIPDMSPVKDQGQLGSCVGFAVCAIKEWQEQTEHEEEVTGGKFDHRDEKYYDLSEQWIYYKAKTIDPWPNDEGTSIRFAMRVLNKIGVPVEKAWPYDDRVKGDPENWSGLVALWSLIGTYERVYDLLQLKQALINAPVAIGIGVYEEIFYVDDDGIIPDPAEPQYGYGGHAIAAVGYNDATQRITIKNSWGTNWGRNGYGYLSYNYINNYMWDAWTCKDLRVTGKMLDGPLPKL